MILALPLVQAGILPKRSADHPRDLPWHQTEDHPVHSLFKRQSNPSDGVTYATVGSSEWLKAYPPGLPDTSKLPQEWVTALNNAVAAGKIPDIAPSKNDPAGLPTYHGLSPTSSEVCSGTYHCRIDGDIWDAPDGYLGCGVSGIFPLSKTLLHQP